MKERNEMESQEFDSEEERKIRLMLNRFQSIYKIRNGKLPPERLVQKERERIIKNYFSNDKAGLHQAEKEDGQIDCLLDILRKEERHLSLEEMSQALVRSGYTVGSSVKTIYRRILPKLLNHGAIKDDDNRYYIEPYRRDVEIEKKMEAIMMEKMEVVSIISNFLETLKDSPVYERAREYIDKEMQHYKRRQSQREDRELDESTLASRVIFMGAPAAHIQEGTWDILNGAMRENRYVCISYKGESKSNAEKYTVQPYQLIFDNGFWELWGECTNRDHRGRRLFNLSRIMDVEVYAESEAFKLPDNYDFRSTLAGNFGCYNDNIAENYSIRIREGSYAYLYIKDRKWGDFQEIRKTGDGYILEFEATQYLPILRWVLSWGAEVEPLEPERLVVDWKEEIEKMRGMAGTL